MLIDVDPHVQYNHMIFTYILIKQLFFILQHIHIPFIIKFTPTPVAYLEITILCTSVYLYANHIYSCSFMLYLKMNNTASQLVMYGLCKEIQLISGMKQNMNLHEKHCCYCL